MKTDRIVFGVILVVVGILFFLSNLKILSWEFVLGLWKLWPLILVLWGLDMIIKENHFLKTLLLLLLVLISFIFYFQANKRIIVSDFLGEDHANALLHFKPYIFNT